MYFSVAASSEKYQGKHEFGFEHCARVLDPAI